jgi:hypothetical protein
MLDNSTVEVMYVDDVIRYMMIGEWPVQGYCGVVVVVSGDNLWKSSLNNPAKDSLCYTWKKFWKGIVIKNRQEFTWLSFVQLLQTMFLNCV